ncbi:MAG: hypothetical protein H7343_06430 [Undibacterium sp.]|nr:hypothetical protein [Opitutaceae bacterium]
MLRLSVHARLALTPPRLPRTQQRSFPTYAATANAEPPRFFFVEAKRGLDLS